MRSLSLVRFRSHSLALARSPLLSLTFVGVALSGPCCTDDDDDDDDDADADADDDEDEDEDDDHDHDHDHDLSLIHI